MKNIILSGVIGAVIAVILNYVTIFMMIYFGWKSTKEAFCLPELEQLLHSGTTAVIVQTIIVAVIGFIVCVLINNTKRML